ncbi:unnamed protein product [Bemisia tabaci]|uniref:Integrin alpha-PS1 n=1 Tax=Bemisia tabaci TaxID=7038 RepID=A0A9P0A4R2_BEMTA|nr:PREDICTED: integrin alpha-PS1-like isoform X3 [Bemisia tabaci]CAH0386379.1 unnamed protein product [Bemisia tabaci]
MYYLIGFIALVIKDVLCFNLETRIPVIKNGRKESYFGYSVAAHQSVNEAINKIQDSWLLVGAPLGQNLQPRTNQSGALWKCPITTELNDCVQVVTDGKRSQKDGHLDKSIDATNLEPPLDDEIKDGQWLGVSLQSQGIGGKVMVCAHRYMKKGEGYRQGQGLCYTLSQHLEFDDSWEPCKGRPTDGLEYEYCQAGTSAVLLEDDTAVIGTPGSRTWRGTVFVVNVSDDYLLRDKTFYYGPISDDTSPVELYSYLGMSATAAPFFGPSANPMGYAAGAPRANGTGQVVLFTRAGLLINPMNVRLILNGDQFASSFGYEIAAADVNGDDEPDLIVGAPFYFGRDSGGAVYVYLNNPDRNPRTRFDSQPSIKMTGKPESRFGLALSSLGDLNKDGFTDIAVGAPYENDGVIYIYLGSKNGLITEPSQVIRSEALPVRHITTLGYSLSGGLDLDQNGYPDLLVGAYNSDSVLLFRARPIVGLLTTVEPEENLRNLDPNVAGCKANPDSPLTCFTFKACCTIDSLLKTESHPSPNLGLTLKYRLEAETFHLQRKFSRVTFDPNNTERPHVLEKEAEIFPQGNGEYRFCDEHTAYIKENTKDIQSPIKFKLTYSLVQRDPPLITPGSPLPSLSEYPILNQQEAAKVFEATFHKDCGNNDVCESELFVEASLRLPYLADSDDSIYELMLGTMQELVVNISVTNLHESAYEAQLFVSHSPSLSYIGRIKQDGKQLTCNPINSTMVACNLGNPLNKGPGVNVQLRFDPKGLSDSETALDFVVFANSTSQQKNPQGPMNLRAQVTKRAELSLKGLARPEQVFYGGQTREDSSIKYLDDIGSRVIHTYQVFNAGPWRVPNLEIHIEWPHKLTYSQNGRCLLYIQEKPHIEALSGGECFMAPGQVNPRGLTHRPGLTESPLDSVSRLSTYSRIPSSIVYTTPVPMYNASKVAMYDRSMNRIRRSYDEISPPEMYVDKDGKAHSFVNLNCALGNAECIKFKCVVYSLQQNQEATVFIKARLWNSSLIEDYSSVDFVRIASRARIHIPASSIIHQNTSDDVAQVETLAKVDLLEQQVAEPVPLWIIVIAILAGLILLILLTYCLAKIGFFKRRRPDPTLSGNIEKHRGEESILSDY